MSGRLFIDNWIKRSELDYYTMFIKSWIPFNAWYMRDFYDESNRTSDSAIISYLKENPNKYRDKIINLIRGNNEISMRFKKHLAQLSNELESHAIPDYENRITFSTTSIVQNSNRQHSFSFGKYTYKTEFRHQLPKTQKRWICEIMKKNTTQTILLIELYNWSTEELESNTDFQTINPEKALQLKKCFSEINPKKPVNLIIPAPISVKYEVPKNCIIIDKDSKLFFINDYEIISKVIIQLLYELRCKLFHGELDPTQSNMGAYKQAYYIQSILIKELE